MQGGEKEEMEREWKGRGKEEKEEKREFKKSDEAAQFMVYKKRENVDEKIADQQLEEAISKLPQDVQDRYKRALYISKLIQEYDTKEETAAPGEQSQRLGRGGEKGAMKDTSADLVEAVKIEGQHLRDQHFMDLNPYQRETLEHKLSGQSKCSIFIV